MSRRTRSCRVTNAINGAYYPEASPDGKTLAYIGYTAHGFDLFVMPLDAARFLPALPYENYRTDAPPIPAHHDYPVHAYNPLATLFPRAYTGTVGPGDFGYEATVSATGSDITGRHNVALSITSELKNPSLQPDLQYSYGGLPVDLNFHVYRGISPKLELLAQRRDHDHSIRARPGRLRVRRELHSADGVRHPVVLRDVQLPAVGGGPSVSGEPGRPVHDAEHPRERLCRDSARRLGVLERRFQFLSGDGVRSGARHHRESRR